MRIWHDTSYVSEMDRKLIAHGLAQESCYSLRFSFVYTPEEREQNRQMSMMSHSMSPECWRQICTQDAIRRSDAMHEVMEEISKQFVCYQYEEKKDYEGPAWDLFFWCNSFNNTYRDSGLTSRDYSYFTLSFNSNHALDKQKEICRKVLELLEAKYANWPNLDVAIQHETKADTAKIQAAVRAALPDVLNYPCHYANMVGKVVQTTKGYFFKKKYARKKGYRLSDEDILDLFWNMPKAESASEVRHAQ